MQKLIRVILVGFTPPPVSRVKDAKLPKEVVAWSSSEIPEQVPKALAKVQRVYYDSYLGDPVRNRLERLFGHRVTGVRSAAHLEAQITSESRVLGKAVGDVLVPAIPFRVTNAEVDRKMGYRLPHSGIRIGRQ